ncbi:hypothetical protein R70331_04510 [Paenibacillus sp. FSL R7-0331]|nr:hypothetical protein R70331_04510 [Paenibacillus sp. FSL R7-0331]
MLPEEAEDERIKGEIPLSKWIAGGMCPHKRYFRLCAKFAAISCHATPGPSTAPAAAAIFGFP